MGRKRNAPSATALIYEETAAEFNKQYDALRDAHPGARILGRFDPYEFPDLEMRRTMKMSMNDKVLSNATKRMKMALDINALSVETEERRVTSAIFRLHQMGYDWVDRDNINDFFRMMEKLREFGLDSIFDSSAIMERMQTARDRGISSEKLLDNMERIGQNAAKGKEYKRLYFKWK